MGVNASTWTALGGFALLLAGCGGSGGVDSGFGGVGGIAGVGGSGGEGGVEEPRSCASSEDCGEGDYCSSAGLCDVIVSGECVEPSDCEFFNKAPRFEVCLFPSDEVGGCYPQELLRSRLDLEGFSLARLDAETGEFLTETDPQLFEQTWSFVARWQLGEEAEEQDPEEIELPYNYLGGSPHFWTELDWNARYVSVEDPDLVVECNLTFLASGEALGAAQFRRVVWAPPGGFPTPTFEVFCSTNDWQAGDPGLFVRYRIVDPLGYWVE